MSEIVEGTAEEVGTAVQVAAPSPPSLFGTDNPAEVIVRASAVAASLKQVLRDRGMVSSIKGKEYVKVEGWQTLGSMLGVVPVVVWTRPVDGGWEARAEARASDGRVVGAAESMCTENEGGNWGPRATSNARRSMAQTRAVSKALRGPLGFVVTLAGYEATPADEMPGDPSPVSQAKPKPLLLDYARAAIRAKDKKRYADDEAWVALREDAMESAAKGKEFWQHLADEFTGLGGDSAALYNAWKGL